MPHQYKTLITEKTVFGKVSESRSIVSYSLWPHRLYSPWNSPGQNTEVGSLSLLQGIFPTQGLNPGIKSRSLTMQEDSLLAEAQAKPKNTRVGSLSLLQWIFLTQKLNWGLLHCRWILYQLSYQGIPKQWGDELSGEGVRRQLFLSTMALLSCLKAALWDLLQVKSTVSFSR